MAETAQRVVFDTSVLVSALLFDRSPLSAFRGLWRRGVLTPLVSRETTQELIRVLAYPKFRLSPDERDELLADYLPFAEVVRLDRHPRALMHTPACRDPADQMFLDTAQAGDATSLVTGDEDLLSLNDPYFRHLRFDIITPATALRRWTA